MQDKSQEKHFFNIFSANREYDVLTPTGYQAITSMFQSLRGKISESRCRIVDLGYGMGNFTRVLKESWAEHYFGLDLSVNTIMVAKRTAADISFCVGDIEHLLIWKNTKMGARFFLNSPINRVLLADGRVKGVCVKGNEYPFDVVITTVPLPYIPELVPDFSDETRARYRQVDNVGIVCVILKLSQKLTESFWLNISDTTIELPGLIEYSNIKPMAAAILYFPFYLHRTHPHYSLDDDVFIAKVTSYCRRINKHFEPHWIEAAHVHRSQYAQPVCTPNFLGRLPRIRTEIKGLYTVDTSYYYPEDRSMSESIRIGHDVAKLVQEDSS